MTFSQVLPLAAGLFGYTGGVLPGAIDERAKWPVTDVLLARAVHLLEVLAWQQTEDGHKNRRPPKPIVPPGFEPQVATPDAVNIDELKDLLNRPREPMGGA